MRVSIRLISATAEARDSANQTIDRFGLAASAIMAVSPRPKSFAELFVGLSIYHPIYHGSKRTSARFHKPTDTVYASAALDYEKWVKPEWHARVAAVAQATEKAINAIGKARITPDERDSLLAAISSAQHEIEHNPPANLMPLEPIYMVNWSSDDPMRSISFAPPLSAPFSSRDVIEIPPVAARKSLKLKIALDDPAMFKLYRRAKQGLEYWEAWYSNEKVVEHKGLCGENGEVAEHEASDAETGRRILVKLRSAKKEAGFKPIAPSRHAMIVVEGPIDGFGAQHDLDVRGKLEDQLDELLGLLGLGHCDGGSTGSGSMEVFCMVVDAKIAIPAINLALAATSNYAGFIARRAER